MEDVKTNAEIEEESLDMVDKDDELTKVVEEQMGKLRTQSMLLGAQSMCRVILQKIYDAQAKPGKKSYRDLERLIIDIKQFCETGISRKVNADGTTSPIEESQEQE